MTYNPEYAPSYYVNKIATFTTTDGGTLDVFEDQDGEQFAVDPECPTVEWREVIDAF